MQKIINSIKNSNYFNKIKHYSHIAKWILYAIISLFLLSRITVILIMSKILPSWLFLNIGNSHIHHYVYGIFIILGLCTYLLFRKKTPTEKEEKTTGFIFGIGITLLFDEFCYWFFFTNNYYSKLSIDSIILIISLVLATYIMPKLKKFGVDTWLESVFIWLLAIGIGLCVIFAGNDLYNMAMPLFNNLNNSSPK